MPSTQLVKLDSSAKTRKAYYKHHHELHAYSGKLQREIAAAKAEASATREALQEERDEVDRLRQEKEDMERQLQQANVSPFLRICH